MLKGNIAIANRDSIGERDAYFKSVWNLDREDKQMEKRTLCEG